METIRLNDGFANYEYTSRGCIEHSGIFWEVLENTGDTSPYFVLWCHEDTPPTSIDELFSKCIFIDYREDDRQVETNDPSIKDLVVEITDICLAELGI